MYAIRSYYDRLAAGTAAGNRHLPDLQPVAATVGRETEQGIVAMRDEEHVDEVLVLDP